jgi:peptidylprolyl isomerase/FKBP-type peptidyl-prolyl cis-trans isomerase FklB
MKRPLILACAALALALAACNKGGEAGPAPDPAAAAAAEAFLAKNAKEPGIKVLPSGIQYKIERSGPEGGPHPKKGDEVKVNYHGTLTNGDVFDSTDERGAPAIFELNNLVDGWMEILPLMRPGDVWTVYIPPKLGYGDKQAGPIPPNSVLVFRLELLGVLPHSGTGLG